jgi:hypothetical protein
MRFVSMWVFISFPLRETGFITPSQTFDIAIIFERSPKKPAYFWLCNTVWVHLNVSIGVANPDRQQSSLDEVTRNRGFLAMISSIPLRYIAATC